MKDKAKQLNKKNGVLITLMVGIVVGSMCTAALISLMINSMKLWLAYVLLGSVFLVSLLFLIFWIYKKELYAKIIGVELKDLSVLAHDVVENINNRDITGLKDRAFETVVFWSTIKARTILVNLLFFLTTSLFLMLNAYVMFKQNDLITSQNIIMEEEFKLVNKQVKISEFHRTEKIFDLVREHNVKFEKIISTISKCGKIYNGNGGIHSYKAVNNYLAFIDNFAIYEKEGLFTINQINDRLGFYFLAFYQNNNGEIEKYVQDVRKHYSDQFYKNLVPFMKKLKSLPENNQLLLNIDRICKLQNKGK